MRDNRQTVVHSCHDSGKSWTAALTACWWVASHPPGEAIVVSTAPGGDQIKGIIWEEMRKIHTALGLMGRMNLTEWYIGDSLVGIGRQSSEYRPAAFQGFRRRYPLVIIDEAQGVPGPIFDAASTLTAGAAGRILVIGNPDDPMNKFAQICRDGSGWKVIHIGYRDTPNFSGEDVGDLAQDLLSVEWVEQKRTEWGEASPLYVSKVLGLFPAEGTEGAIPFGWVQRCREIELPEGEPHEAGLDVGMGGDRTVLRERRGPRVGREAIWRSKDPLAQVDDICRTLREWGVKRLKVDTDWTTTFSANIKKLSSAHNVPGRIQGETTHDAEVVEIKFGASAVDSAQFENVRAELYWGVGRERSRLEQWDLRRTDVDDPTTGAGPVDDALIAELVAMRRVPGGTKGRIKMEPKENTIKRLGRSPDRAEALLLAFYDVRTEVSTPKAAALTSARWDT